MLGVLRQALLQLLHFAVIIFREKYKEKYKDCKFEAKCIVRYRNVSIFQSQKNILLWVSLFFYHLGLDSKVADL